MHMLDGTLIPLLAFGFVVSRAAAAALPNIVYILLDDYGWADAGWHQSSNDSDFQTPHMNALLHEGIELNRHYAFKYCSPARSAIQSGRNPIHVNVLNLVPGIHNPKDLVSGYTEMPRNMTGMAEHLLRAGYETHFYGKWHAGDATMQHTPYGRGYQNTLSYLGGSNDYWTSHGDSCLHDWKRVPIVDLWGIQSPAHGLNNSATCSQDRQEGCIYEDQLFADRAFKAIDEHSRSKPLFLFWSPHIVHEPLEVPDKELQRFSHIDDPYRRHYAAMVSWVDKAIGTFASKLKQTGLWSNTLVVVHADNGGPIYIRGTAGANNFPLKGGKRSNWEGGVRVNAFVSGGLLPPSVRGTKQEGLIAAWDWYATFAALAGVDPTDTRAKAAGLPPIDSINMWPLISGQVVDSPRKELALGDTESLQFHLPSATRVGGLIDGRYKLLLGNISQSVWTGPVYPNKTSHTLNPDDVWQSCGQDVETGCLFDVVADPGEHNNLAKQEGARFKKMLARVAELQKGVFSPNRGSPGLARCRHALNTYGGFFGPYVDADVAVVAHERELVV